MWRWMGPELWVLANCVTSLNHTSLICEMEENNDTYLWGQNKSSHVECLAHGTHKWLLLFFKITDTIRKKNSSYVGNNLWELSRGEILFGIQYGLVGFGLNNKRFSSFIEQSFSFKIKILRKIFGSFLKPTFNPFLYCHLKALSNTYFVILSLAAVFLYPGVCITCVLRTFPYFFTWFFSGEGAEGK